MAEEKKPASPSYQPLNLPAYQPVNATGQYKKLLPLLSQYADVNIDKQAKAQQVLSRGAYDLTAELAPKTAQLRSDLLAKYGPQYVEQYNNLIDQADPSFRAVRDKLGARVSSDLDAGYSLGNDLSREVEDSIRAAQSARGNWLGPAATAQEAFGKASAMVDLNNQRQANARGFLSSRAPSDMFASYGIAEGYQPVNVITPTGTYVDPSIPANLATAEAQNQTNYNQALIGAYGANTSAQFGSYDRQWDRYLYGQAVANGLYSPVSSGGGGMSGQAIGGAIGTGVGTVVGAYFGGVGAPAGAAAGGAMGSALGGMF